MVADMMALTHCHAWEFLRQEEQNVGYDRNPTWHIFDVYFCRECLDYQRVHIRTEVPDHRLYRGSERLVLWNKGGSQKGATR